MYQKEAHMKKLKNAWKNFDVKEDGLMIGVGAAFAILMLAILVFAVIGSLS